MARAERIYLTGFMGAGKSAIGRRLAARLGWQFVDLDESVEAAASRTVGQLFAELGEEGFRGLERAALERTLERSRLVVATGGGTLARPGAAELLRGRGLIVWIKPPFAELVARIEASGPAARPLYLDRRQALRLYRRRLPFYRRADLVLAVDGGQSLESITSRLTAELGIEACAT